MPLDGAPVSADHVQELFAGYHAEIQRRRDVSVSPVEHTYFAPASGVGPREFRLADQQFVLYSLSQTGFAPRRRGPASIRIYGTFETADDAKHHAQLVLSIDPDVSMLVSATHEWCLAAETPERMGAAAGPIVEQKLAAHRAALLREDETFRDDEARRDTRDAPADGGEGTDGSAVPAEDQGERRGAHRRLPVHAQVVGQKVVALSTIVDETEEFLFRVYACFETADEADVWVRSAAAKHVTDVHVDTTSTCVWLVPRTMTGSNAPLEAYRHPELDKIMNHMKGEPARVQEYKDWRRAHELSDAQTGNTAVLCDEPDEPAGSEGVRSASV